MYIYEYPDPASFFQLEPNSNVLINPFSINVPFMQKPCSWFLIAKRLKNFCGRVTFYIKMHVDDMHRYLKCHSSTGVFQTFCQQKPTTWFIHNQNIGRKWVKFPRYFFAFCTNIFLGRGKRRGLGKLSSIFIWR